jgi:ribosomal protein S9
MSDHEFFQIPHNPRDATRKDPTYSVDHCLMAKRMALLGLKDAELAKVFGISLNRFFEWQMDHPELASAVATGRDIADSRVAEALYKRATGYQQAAVKVLKIKTTDGEEVVDHSYVEEVPPDPAAAKFWLTARRPDLWRDQTHSNLSGSVEVTGSGISGLLQAARAAAAKPELDS